MWERGHAGPCSPGGDPSTELLVLADLFVTCSLARLTHALQQCFYSNVAGKKSFALLDT